MKLSHSTLALTLSIAAARFASACDAASTASASSVAIAAPIVVTEPFAVPVATFVQPQALVTPTVVTPTLVTPTIVPAIPQTVVIKEVVRPRGRVLPKRASVQVTRTVTRSR